MDTAALTLVYKIDQVIINPLIGILFGVAMLYFIWGVYKLWIAGSPEEHAQGAQHVMWSIVGMLIMIGVFTIMHIVLNTIGATAPATLQ